jgi:hypothetical protein
MPITVMFVITSQSCTLTMPITVMFVIISQSCILTIVIHVLFRSRSRDRERSGFVKSGRRSSINTPHVKGWLQSAEIIPGTKDRLGKPRSEYLIY